MRTHAKLFGLQWIEAPFEITRFQMKLVVPNVALKDAGIAWLMDVLERNGRREEVAGPRDRKQKRTR